MRLDLNTWLMSVAALTGERSTCCRRHVGCVLVNDKHHIIATGYNGVAAGMPHCNEVVFKPTGASQAWGELPIEVYPNACAGSALPSGQSLDLCEAIHAEQNALLQCRSVHEIERCYVTASPCVTCVKLLLNTSCQEIYFLEEYPQPQARELWFKGGRKVWEQLNVVDPLRKLL